MEVFYPYLYFLRAERTTDTLPSDSVPCRAQTNPCCARISPALPRATCTERSATAMPWGKQPPRTPLSMWERVS